MKRLILAVLAVGVLAVPAAAKPGNSLALDQASPSFGDTISFTVAATFPVPQVNALCYQDETLVYSGLGNVSNGFSMNLASVSWTSGAAECVASLYEWNSHAGKAKVWAEIEFSVSA